MVRIGFIGAGTVGTALAIGLSRAGFEVVAACSRSYSSAERLARRVPGARALGSGQEVAAASDLVFVTTPDDAIGLTVEQVQWTSDNTVVHCSGVASTDILDHASRQGALVGTFHPLQSFANVEQAILNLPGSTIAIEGSERAVAVLKSLAEGLGGKWVILQAGDKILYHAAAVIVSNYTVALAKMATDLWREFGVESPEAIRALMPLLQGTLNNIANVGLPNCLTGPIARGDVGTVAKHIEALRERAPWLLDAYRALGLQAVPVSLAKGKIDARVAAELEDILFGNQSCNVDDRRNAKLCFER